MNICKHTLVPKEYCGHCKFGYVHKTQATTGDQAYHGQYMFNLDQLGRIPASAFSTDDEHQEEQ